MNKNIYIYIIYVDVNFSYFNPHEFIFIANKFGSMMLTFNEIITKTIHKVFDS